MQKQPHTEQDRKRQDAISELHRRNRDEAAWVQRHWDRLPRELRDLVKSVATLQARCDEEDVAAPEGEPAATSGGDYMSPAERVACLRASARLALQICHTALLVRWDEGFEVAILDRHGQRVRIGS